MNDKAIPIAKRNTSHVGGWRRCAECRRQTWDTENGLCVQCRLIVCDKCGKTLAVRRNGAGFRCLCGWEKS